MSYLKKSIAKEVKEEILAKVKAGESVASAAKVYGISDNTIYNWIKGRAERHVSFLEYARLRKENDQLKQIIGVLSLEVEKSKKKTGR